MNLQALSELSSFNCTEQYWKLPLFRRLVYTDGVRHLVKNADCYWLLDEIAGAQHEAKIKNDESLQGMQFWTLKKVGPSSATLICERDTDDVAWTKQIEFTDFPFATVGDAFRIWVAPTFVDGVTKMVAYLPSEH